MSENVFVVWGKNEAIARSVEAKLIINGYFPTVGGVKKGAKPLSFFINSNVISQMDAASTAIILVQKILDRQGNPTSEFRPNLMFEWGYLQKRLRADSIHVFLINIKREELPSDLLNSYTTTITLDNQENPSISDIEKAADDIVSAFMQNVSEFDFDGLEIIRDYDAYRTILSEMTQEKRAFNPREAGYFLLHMIQPAFYRNDLDFIKACLTKMSQMVSGPFVSTTILVSQIISYYEIADHLNEVEPSKRNDVTSKHYRELELIVLQLEHLRNQNDKIFNIFDVLLEDFIGLSYLQMYQISPDPSTISKSITAFKAALRECAQFKSVFQANDGFVRTLWGGYIERNLSRAYYFNNDMEKAKHYQKEAEKKRITIIGQSKAAGISYISKQLDLELGLSKFDEALHSGASEGDLTQIIDKYLTPLKPRGVDRVWERLHAAVEKEVAQRKYTNLTAKLNKLKRTH